MIRRCFPLVAAAICFAGCSTQNATPNPVSTPLPLAVQRNQAQAGIVAANGIQAASLLAAIVESLAPPARAAAPSAACKNGVEKTVVVGTTSVQITIDLFYEAKCLHRFAHALVTATLGSRSNVGLTGTQIFYTRQGKAVAYGKIQGSATFAPSGNHATALGTISPQPSGPSVLAFGLACTFAKKNDCGFGGIASVLPQKVSLGVSTSIRNFVANGQSNDGAIALNAYQGKLGSLSIARGSGDNWIVRGGTLVVGQSGSFTESVDSASLTVAGGLHLADRAAGAVADVRFQTKAGIIGGSVLRNNGATDARFSTDAIGTGSITYSNGSAGNIVLFIITS